MDKVTILQPAGLGDILFCQKIAYKLIEYGYDVYWPMHKYSWVSQYIKKDNLTWSNPIGRSEFLVLQNSIESNHPYDIMTCKYDMIGKTLNHFNMDLHSIDYSDWVDFLRIKRNEEKENRLFYEVLGLKENEKYVFINRMYGVNQYNSEVGKKIINKGLRHVELNFINGYTLFDWCRVLENASEIHTVDTSINYVIETLNIKTDKLFLYPRHPDHIFKCLHKLFKTKWEWVS
jgi:hypothetical protein